VVFTVDKTATEALNQLQHLSFYLRLAVTFTIALISMKIGLRLMFNNLLHGLIAPSSSWEDFPPTMPHAPAHSLLYKKYDVVNLIRGQVTF
jgi:hypothetical protein